MHRASACIFLVLLMSPALADPISDATVIANSKNPVGAALASSAFGCNLLGPPSPQRDLAGSPGPGVAGTITVPKLLPDGYSYDLSASGQLCQLTDNTRIPFIDLTDPKSKITGGIQTISFTNDIEAQLKLTMGSWLNLIDFNAQDLNEVGIFVNAEAYDLSEQKLRTALLNMRKESGNACSALTDPNARQIVRSCYGLVTVSLQAKKDLSLNALDLKFANLVVGLKAKWLRDVSGAATDCKAPGMESAPATPKGGAADAPPVTPAPGKTAGAAGKAAGAPATAPAAGKAAGVPAASAAGKAAGAPAPNKNGVEATIKLPAGVVSILPAGADITIQMNSDKITMSAPTAADVATAQAQPQNKDNATPQAVQAAEAAKPVQPPAQDKICVQNVVYRTSDVMIIGAHFLDGPDTKKNQDWLKLQP